jgi:hypothetical protein
MRTLLALILSVLLPARGKRRAVPSAPTPVARPHHAKRPLDVIHADGLPLVRPYLTHFEQQREAQLQRERRRAAVLASMGQDYVPAVSA